MPPDTHCLFVQHTTISTTQCNFDMQHCFLCQHSVVSPCEWRILLRPFFCASNPNLDLLWLFWNSECYLKTKQKKKGERERKKRESDLTWQNNKSNGTSGLQKIKKKRSFTLSADWSISSVNLVELSCEMKWRKPWAFRSLSLFQMTRVNNL